MKQKNRTSAAKTGTKAGDRETNLKQSKNEAAASSLELKQNMNEAGRGVIN